VAGVLLLQLTVLMGERAERAGDVANVV